MSKKASRGSSAKPAGSRRPSSKPRRDASSKVASAKKGSARSDSTHSKAGDIAAILRGEASFGLPGWLTGELAYAWYIQNGVARQMIGRFAMLMTKPSHKYTNTDVRDFS